ncbi:MAG: hypothetical protein IIV84_01660 [Selenomonadales bacterium]|nr:hypothetical protein [Selenomonadales bacterium]
MRKARRYQGRGQAECVPRSFGSGAFCALVVSVVLCILLLLVISLIEWTMPDLLGAYSVYTVFLIPLVCMAIGAYIGSRRLARKAVWLGGINGFICWLIGLCIAWCSSADITVLWLGVSLGICLITSFIGALLGVLRVR